MRDLPENAKYDLCLRIYDLMQYENLVFARRYVEMVRKIYRRDSAARGFAATQAVICNLAKVTLIKDEPYVSYLLTRYEKKQRDAAKYNLDILNGDRLTLPPPHQPRIQHRPLSPPPAADDDGLAIENRPPHEMVAKTTRLAQTRNRVSRLVCRVARPREPEYR